MFDRMCSERRRRSRYWALAAMVLGALIFGLGLGLMLAACSTTKPPDRYWEWNWPIKTVQP